MLLLLLGLLLLGAATFERRDWPAVVGDEATYLMQAQSLAYDGDLLYESRDFRRFLRLWERRPEGLILQSGDGGETITYGKPFFYALYLAPFVRVAPVRGVFVANTLLLCLVALVAARRLRPLLGAGAPLWIAVFLFASVTFAHVFWAHADLFLMCLLALGLLLAFRRPEGSSSTGEEDDTPTSWRQPVGLAATGALLAVVVFSRPLYAPLFLPAAFGACRRRWRGLASVAGGALAVVVVSVLVHQSLAGSWTGYGAERTGFYSYTGFPAVDFPASDWPDAIERWGSSAAVSPARALAEKPVAPRVWGWNAVYFLVGRHVGVLPYFLPLLLVFVPPLRDAPRWIAVGAVAISVALFFFLKPFNFYGGGASLANRYFLPLYPAFWIRTRAARWRLAPAVLIAACSIPFLAPLWLSPRAFPHGEDGPILYVSSVARRSLPYETTQSHLKPSGQEDFHHAGLWLKPLDPRVRSEGEVLVLRGEGSATLLLGAGRRLEALEIALEDDAESELVVEGTTISPGKPARVALGSPRARHPMWWTEEPIWLHEIELRIPDGDGPVAFRLRPSG